MKQDAQGRSKKMTKIFDGFWLPKILRDEIITDKTPWVVQFMAAGRPASELDPLAIGARWPILTPKQWEIVYQYLDENRLPLQPNFVSRLQSALTTLFQPYRSEEVAIPKEMVDIFTAYTGYSHQMVLLMLSLLDDEPFSAIQKILQVTFPASIKQDYVSIPQLGGPEGWIRFYEHNSPLSWKKFFKKPSEPLSYKSKPPHSVLGFASGNVLGAAFIISFLSQVCGLAAYQGNGHIINRIPSILVKNSRQEPIFVPFLFSALEAIDPELLSSVAVMVWDYEDIHLQNMLLSRSDLVLAAAADHTITQIDNLIKKVNPSARFHPHGHKTSFTTIGKEYLKKASQPLAETAVFDQTALLAALDSILWDQNGCLSSRIHFVEQGSQNDYSPLDYGTRLAEKLRILSQKIPRGNIPLSRIHDRFDHFNAQAISKQVKLCSKYEDDFIVLVDERQWDQQQFKSTINSCMERTIVIRPVATIQDVPEKYLSQLPRENLQTMYVAIDGQSQQTWSPEFSQFVDHIGKCGITSIRTIGQSPFPQLAYSWDGFMPHSLSLEYPAGYFTTVEFDHTYEKIQQAWQWLANRIG